MNGNYSGSTRRGSAYALSSFLAPTALVGLNCGVFCGLKARKKRHNLNVERPACGLRGISYLNNYGLQRQTQS